MAEEIILLFLSTMLFSVVTLNAFQTNLCVMVITTGKFEDERNCTRIKILSCNSRETACKNGSEIIKCIPKTSWWDGNIDCDDGQDELNCLFYDTSCQYGKIACPRVKKCIDLHQVCDRRNDRGNNKDEEKCTRNSATSCPLALFTCPNSDKRISQSLICDGNNDCGNNEDELDCRDKADRDKFLKFVCFKAGKVISKSWLCDGLDDCGNSADERNCFSYSVFCRNKYLFHCGESD